MKKYNGLIQKSLLILLTCFFIITLSCHKKILAETSFNITINYQKDGVIIQKVTEYNTQLKSVKLADYNDKENGEFYGWTPTTLIDGIYENAFSGWKLVSINGEEVSNLHYYPDNDFIYSNDIPFNNYNFDENIEIIFEPMFARRIYLRDKYNFVNINNVFGDNVSNAKINWDESKEYAYSIVEANESTTDDIENVGSSYNNPVSNIVDAITLLGTKGGEIVTVNHYTLKNDDKYYDYSGKKTSGNYTIDLGKNVKEGIITYTGLNYGFDPFENGNEQEKAYEKSQLTSTKYNDVYKNAYWYCLNTRGNQGSNGHSFNLYFDSDTVLEDLNIVGYREIYKTNVSRYNNQVYFYVAANARFVMMESFEAYKRNTSEKKLGYDATNWGHSSISLEYSGKNYSLGALSHGGKSYLQIYSGSYCKKDGFDNIYLTLYGTVSDNNFYDGFYHYSIVFKENKTTLSNIEANNIHLHMENVSLNSDFMGINQGLSATVKCKFFGTYLYNFENTATEGFITSVYNTKSATINEAVWIFDGDNTEQLLRNVFIGGTLETTDNKTSSVTFDDIYIGVYNKAYLINLFGGGNQFAIEVNIKNNLVMDINGGIIKDLYGGSQGGTINANKIELNINGGTITNLYGGGAGGFVTCSSSNSPKDLTGYKYDDNYKYFTNSAGSSIYIEGISIGLIQQEVTFESGTNLYDVLSFENHYAQSDIDNLGDYYLTSRYIAVSNALVTTTEGININVNGGTISKNIYGGGQNGAVNSDINIVVNGGKITGNIFGGGSGQNTSFSAKSYLGSSFFKGVNYDIKYTSNKDALTSDKLKTLLENTPDTVYKNEIAFLQEKGINQTNIDKYKKTIMQYSDFDKLNILTNDELGNSYIEIYTDVIETLGSINGDTNLTINNGTINGSIFGGSDGEVAKIEGNTLVNINNGTISGSIYGGGNVAGVTGNAVVNITNAKLNNVFGGGNQGPISGSTYVSVLENAQIANIYAGSNQANVGENTNVSVLNGTISNLYGGNNLTGTIVGKLNTNISGGIVTNLYGGGNQANTTSDTYVTVSNGTVSNLYGGGKEALVNKANIVVNNANNIDKLYGGGYVGNINTDTNIEINGGFITYIYGGGYSGDILGNTNIFVTDGNITDIYGGGYVGDILGNTNISVTDGNILNIYGGGYQGAIDKETFVNFDGGTVEFIYGGGYEGNVINNTYINITNGTITQNIYGGGYEGNVNKNSYIEITNGYVIGSIYGGGFAGNISNSVYINYIDGTVENNIYGGGYQGDIYNSNIILNNGLINGSIYGGGFAGDVSENVDIKILGGTINKSVYGGGYEGNVISDTYITVNRGTINENIYGGGYAGTVENTNVEINEADYNQILIGQNVFGGGKGVSATVYNSTNVLINLKLNMNIFELPVSTAEITSGETKVEVEFKNEYSKILGSVYGGGDLGQVGQGTINTSNNTATISKAGTTCVKIENGYIAGSVFGGGSGVPTEEKYELRMGSIYGSTNTIINGGYIGTNIYGGGTQSRVYFSNKNDTSIQYATNVLIQEVEKIVINGSVFGGGDRGNSATTNASVPTTIGDVLVTIEGKHQDIGSEIYFVNGGVYGDGNLCLANGTKTINIKNFTKNSFNLKTFYSLQRANVVNLINTDIVLLGAVDLVEEGDATIYSINRIDELNLHQGSTIKLDQIVKYLGKITSDFEFNQGDGTRYRKFINQGNNGSNHYGQTRISPNPLTQDEINEYRSDISGEKKNLICVANGLYLEIRDKDNKLGKVEGLFSLELLVANLGEGGGFVYASIEESTGDFICEVTFQDETKYMDVIDNVGGYTSGDYTYYLWYIQGSIINYKVGITGYIGSDEETYLETVVIPEHNISLSYVLNEITINDIFNDAIKNNKYHLVTKSNGLKNQEIAIEVMIGTESIGYVVYDNIEDVFKLYVNETNDQVKGYEDKVDNLLSSVIKKNIKVSQENSQVSLILHKSKDVNAETNNMQVSVKIDLCNYNESSSITTTIKHSGTSTLTYQIGFSIVRLVPVQEIYTGPNKNYTGLNSSTNIMLTLGSSFSIEYQTRYIPSAFPDLETSTMQWNISLKGYKYYMDNVLGNYLTLDENGNCISISPTLTFDENDSTKIQVIKTATGYQYEHNGKIISLDLQNQTSTTLLPKGTKITLVDLSSDGNPTYYYYIYQGNELEINLDDFYLMGTQTKIKNSSIIPTYKKLYKGEKEHEQEASRITERIVLIFDLGQVAKENYNNVIDNIFEGNIVLEHKYNNIDIMDYVKTETINDETSYSRSTPKVANFKVNMIENGIEKFEVEFIEDSYFANTNAQLEITVEKDEIYSNTQLSDGSIGIKIETNNNEDLPDGIEFIYQGIYLPKYGNKYLIIPIKNYGTYVVDLINELGTIETSVNKATYKATLCYLPDEQYYNETILVNTTISSSNIECDIVEEQKTSLNIEIDNKYISISNTNSIDIKAYLKNSTSNEIEFTAYIKKQNNLVETNQIYTRAKIVGSENGTNATLYFDSQIEVGIYQLQFKNNNKIVIINIIIK